MGHQISTYPDDRLIEMYTKMKMIREFEIRIEELAEQNAFPGGPHLYIGQEAVAVGICLPLRSEDIIGSTHRGHGHLIAKGADVTEMMAEIAGKQGGLNHGRAGTMHMVDFSLGIYGLNGIVGASCPHVVGGVLAGALDSEETVGVSFFGDGAINEGVVYESMNVAAVWELPVLFVCENNRYAGTLAADDGNAGDQLTDRAEAMGIPAETVDGQDVFSVYESARDAIKRARNGGGPQFIECETYRYREHSFNTRAALGDRTYRNETEIERWEDRDPIDLFVRRLEERPVLSADRRAEIDEEIRATIDSAVNTMEGQSFPPATKALDDMYKKQDYAGFPALRYR